MQSTRLPLILVLLLACLTRGVMGQELWPAGLDRIRQEVAEPLVLSDGGRPGMDVVLLSDSPVVRGAADWLVAYVKRAGADLPLVRADHLVPGRIHLVAAVGQDDSLIRQLVAEGKFHPETRVGAQGFVVERTSDAHLGELLICWSPEPIGCRYGLIEILRSLRVSGQKVTTSLGHVVERPQFPTRICYVNFAEHLQNAFGPNLLFDSPVNRWSLTEWDRFIDMISACRYNVFEFWLVPTLFSPEALQGGKIQADFAKTMNHVIAYAKTQGVAVHPIQAVNTVGQSWHYHCPKDPKEHAEIVALWDHWSRALVGNEMIGFFPGDPGGCFRNGCTAETFVDLCLELSKVVRQNNPTVKIEVGTWGDPFAGWGVPLWTGDSHRAEIAMKYFLAKLPEFPPETFTSINLGFSPDCDATHGGDARPFAKEAAKICPVLTWDYSVTEGEGTVSPRCRVRRIFQRRLEELAEGCYSGGICYTMAPQLNCLSIFCCAEAWWNPAQQPDDVLHEYGRLVFGEDLAAIGPLLEEFEVVPDWGYYPPFPYSPQRVSESMGKLRNLLERMECQEEGQLRLAPTPAEYRESLLFYTNLFEKLAAVAIGVETMTAVAKESGKMPRAEQGLVSLDDVQQLLSASEEFSQKARLRELADGLRRLDAPQLTKTYWDRVYGIYDVIPHPTDPRAQGATSTLFQRFHCELAVAHLPTPLEQALRATNKPYEIVDLGRPVSEQGWDLKGWTLQGEDQGHAWRASFDEPGIIAHSDFHDQEYRWLVVRLTEGPAGGRKRIAVNGTLVGEFLRTGPPVSERKEWWVVRSYPIPEGLLTDGPLEIRFTLPGVAIDSVGLAAERVPDTQ